MADANYEFGKALAVILAKGRALAELKHEIATCTDETRRQVLERQLEESFPQLLAEQIEVGANFVEALIKYQRMLTVDLPAADDATRASVQKPIDDLAAKCRRLGERVVQAHASQSALSGTDGLRSA